MYQVRAKANFALTTGMLENIELTHSQTRYRLTDKITGCFNKCNENGFSFIQCRPIKTKSKIYIGSVGKESPNPPPRSSIFIDNGANAPKNNNACSV